MRYAYTVTGLLRGTLAAVVLLAAAPLAQAQGMMGQGTGEQGIRPVIFVHGGSGSFQQIESQVLRFESNGYPPGYVDAVEYNSTAIQMILPDVLNRIDAKAAELKMKFGFDKVDLIGHSLGTTVSQAYLSTPDRAANINSYVNVDGRTAMALPGGVRTLALFAGAARPVQGQIVGATNVTLPDQEHVQAVSSQEAFVEMFRFFTGQEPVNGGQIVPMEGPFPVSGRTAIFPQNTGVGPDASVAVFALNPDNGQRTRTMMGMFNMPVAVLPVDLDGFFDSFQAMPETPYEFQLMRPTNLPHTFYLEPFLRADSTVRLLTGTGDAGIELLTERDPASSVFIISRMKELRGDRGPEFDDVLSVNGINLANASTFPSGFVGAPVAILAMDVRTDGVNNLASVPPAFNNIGFITATDVFIPSSPFFLGVRIFTVPRGNTAMARMINIRNTPSTAGAVSVQLLDFEQ